MNFLAFHQYFGFPSQPGSTRMYYLTKGLIERGHAVTIITGSKCRTYFKDNGSSGLIKNYKLDSHLRIISINDYYSQHLSFFKRILSFAFFAFISVALSLIIKKHDIVFASSTPLTIALPAIIYKKVNKIPFVLEIRDLWPEAPIQLGVLKNRFLIMLANRLEKSAYRAADIIIGLSKGIVNKILRKTLNKRVEFIPNGVDEDFFLDGVAEKSAVDTYILPDNAIKIIYAGSCGYNNAIDTLFELISRFNTLNTEENKITENVLFIIIGDGPALEVYKKNVPENILLLGKLPKNETIEMLKKADIALHPQRKLNVLRGSIKKDSLPNKFFDYIGAGIPVLAAVIEDGEEAELINQNNCGICVEPENVEKLYEKMVWLIVNKQERKKMSENAKSLAHSFDRTKQIDKYISLLIQ